MNRLDCDNQVFGCHCWLVQQCERPQTITPLGFAVTQHERDHFKPSFKNASLQPNLANNAVFFLRSLLSQPEFFIGLEQSLGGPASRQTDRAAKQQEAAPSASTQIKGGAGSLPLRPESTEGCVRLLGSGEQFSPAANLPSLKSHAATSLKARNHLPQIRLRRFGRFLAGKLQPFSRFCRKRGIGKLLQQPLISQDSLPPFPLLLITFGRL